MRFARSPVGTDGIRKEAAASIKEAILNTELERLKRRAFGAGSVHTARFALLRAHHEYKGGVGHGVGGSIRNGVGEGAASCGKVIFVCIGVTDLG